MELCMFDLKALHVFVKSIPMNCLQREMIAVVVVVGDFRYLIPLLENDLLYNLHNRFERKSLVPNIFFDKFLFCVLLVDHR